MGFSMLFVIIALSACNSTNDKENEDPNPGGSKVTTWPVIGTSIDGIAYYNADSILYIGGGSSSNLYFNKFKLNDKNGDIKIKFENAELKDISGNKDLLLAFFKDWENTSVEIANKNGITAESKDGKENTVKIYNKKAYWQPMFYNFKDKATLEKLWQTISDHSWSIVINNQFNKDFKYQGKEWRYK